MISPITYVRRSQYLGSRLNFNVIKRLLNINKILLMNEKHAGPVTESITDKLKKTFNPNHIQVINESYQHNVPPGSETHFKVVVISSKFEGLPLIKRHRLINEALEEELSSGVHALSIVAKTPSQWDDGNQLIESSPPCRGGFGM